QHGAERDANNESEDVGYGECLIANERPYGGDEIVLQHKRFDLFGPVAITMPDRGGAACVAKSGLFNVRMFVHGEILSVSGRCHCAGKTLTTLTGSLISAMIHGVSFPFYVLWPVRRQAYQGNALVV